MLLRSLRKISNISYQTSYCIIFGKAQNQNKGTKGSQNLMQHTREGLISNLWIKTRSHSFQVPQTSVTEVASFSSRLILFWVKTHFGPSQLSVGPIQSLTKIKPKLVPNIIIPGTNQSFYYKKSGTTSSTLWKCQGQNWVLFLSGTELAGQQIVRDQNGYSLLFFI